MAPCLVPLIFRLWEDQLVCRGSGLALDGHCPSLLPSPWCCHKVRYLSGVRCGWCDWSLVLLIVSAVRRRSGAGDKAIQRYFPQLNSGPWECD